MGGILRGEVGGQSGGPSPLEGEAQRRRAPPETAQVLLAPTVRVVSEFGTVAHNGWGTALAREWVASSKPVVGLIHFLLSQPLAYHWLPNGQDPALMGSYGRRTQRKPQSPVLVPGG
jgi:hypothetical protein